MQTARDALGPPARRPSPEIVLILVTFVWGGTFLVTQHALEYGGPFGLLLTRFTIAASIVVILFRRRLAGMSRGELAAGTAIGVVTFLSFATQTVGLQFIPSSKSAFITALYVPAVPLLQIALLRAMPRRSAWLAIGLAFAGLLVLSSIEDLGVVFGIGEWLTAGCALFAALQIVLVSRWAPAMDPIRLAWGQFVAVATLCLPAMIWLREPLPHFSASFMAATFALGTFGTAFALGAMNWAQRTVSATRATVIYALEPVWAGLFGAVAGEPMSARTLVGAALIVLGIIVSGLPLASRGES